VGGVRLSALSLRACENVSLPKLCTLTTCRITSTLPSGTGRPRVDFQGLVQEPKSHDSHDWYSVIRSIMSNS